MGWGKNGVWGDRGKMWWFKEISNAMVKWEEKSIGDGRCVRWAEGRQEGLWHEKRQGFSPGPTCSILIYFGLIRSTHLVDNLLLRCWFRREALVKIFNDWLSDNLTYFLISKYVWMKTMLKNSSISKVEDVKIKMSVFFLHSLILLFMLSSLYVFHCLEWL